MESYARLGIFITSDQPSRNWLQQDRWKALLSQEISKTKKLMDKESLKQNRRDDRRDIGRKSEIFKNGIK